MPMLRWVRRARRSTKARGVEPTEGRARAATCGGLQDALAARADEITDLVIAEGGHDQSVCRSHQVGLPIEHLGYWADAARATQILCPIRRRSSPVATALSGSAGGWFGARRSASWLQSRRTTSRSCSTS